MFSKESFQNKSSIQLFLKEKGLCGRLKHCIYLWTIKNIQMILFLWDTVS